MHLTSVWGLEFFKLNFFISLDAGYNLEPPPQKVLDFGGGKPRKIGVYDLKTFSEEGIRDIRAVYPKVTLNNKDDTFFWHHFQKPK